MVIEIENNTPPMTYYDENGELTGFNVEFAKTIFSKLDVDVIFKNVDRDKKETKLNNKNINCLWNSMTFTKNRRKYIDFSHYYLKINKLWLSKNLMHLNLLMLKVFMVQKCQQEWKLQVKKYFTLIHIFHK